MQAHAASVGDLISACDLLVVGAGFFGLTVAERAAAERGLRVLVIERRPHIGGNAWSETHRDTGIEIHRYGSHLFHCNDEPIWQYVNRFASFTDYRHHVYATAGGQVFTMPINLGTICSFFRRALTPDQARKLLAQQAGEFGSRDPANLEEKAISLIGRPLYEAFIQGYTTKQWQTDPRELPAGIITRLPVRFDFNARYFSDRFEGLPRDGYAALFGQMTANHCIEIVTGVDYASVRGLVPSKLPVVFTGPIDRYFHYCDGRLNWRSLEFEELILDCRDHQGCAVMNYSDASVPYTRVHEFRHLHPERHYGNRTVVFREYSHAAGSDDEPFYPVGTPEDRQRYHRYAARAAKEVNVFFGGRLGSYKYLDMHQAIGAALKLWQTQLAPLFAGRASVSGTEKQQLLDA
ncbi:MAG TPA: UDP-galactopyranose mutase [Acetobacteraceae bacterium]